MLLEVDRVDIAYRGHRVVEAMSFALAQGAIGCLLGPSGCGKTTLLRAIAGFEPVAAGAIRLNGEAVSTPALQVPPERRGVGMVFQDFALFPHLDVTANIGFGLRRWRAAERAARVAELLDLIGLAERGRAYPHQLSGGQQQRVALARALAPRPRLLLLDEPFSSLDVALREELAGEVRRILRHEGSTAILVTHDQLEAFALADEIGVLQGGRLRQWDSGYNLYHRPADRFVADFIGQGRLLAGRVLDPRTVQTALGPMPSREAVSFPVGTAVEVLVRPDDVVHADGGIEGLIVERAFRGAEYLYTLRLDSGEQVLCLTPSHDRHEPGERLRLRLASEHLVIFPARS